MTKGIKDLLRNAPYIPADLDEYERRIAAVCERMGVRSDIDPLARMAMLGWLLTLSQPEFGRPAHRPRKPVSDDERLASVVDRLKGVAELTDRQVLIMLKAYLRWDPAFGKDADWLRALVRPNIDDGTDLDALRSKVSNGRKKMRRRKDSYE